MNMRSYFAPFGLRPKKPSDGPRYGDTNDRTMAAAIDLMLLYLLLHKISEFTNAKVFAYYNLQLDFSYAHAANWKEFLNLLGQELWQARWPLIVSNGIFVIMIGMLVVTCQIAYGTTPGKYLLGLKIVRRGTLEPVERWRYVLRFFGYLVAGAPLMLGIIWMNFNKQRRGWQDYIAGTVVLSTRPHGWYMQQIKRGYRKLRGRPEPLAVEQPVGKPAAEQRHGDGDQPVE